MAKKLKDDEPKEADLKDAIGESSEAKAKRGAEEITQRILEQQKISDAKEEKN